MRTWGFVNQKGGCGKTTGLLNVGLAGMHEGLTVAIVDTDQQRSADKWGVMRAERVGEKEPVIVRGEPEALKAMIASARENGTDLLLIDTPGAINKALAYVAANSDLLIVPTRSASLDRDALDDTLDYLGVINALPKTVVLFNAFSGNKEDRRAIEATLARHGVKRLGVEIDDNPAYGTLLGKGLGATEGRKGTKPGQRIREVYRELKAFDKALALGREEGRG